MNKHANIMKQITMAIVLLSELPKTRESSLTLTKLDEARFWLREDERVSHALSEIDAER